MEATGDLRKNSVIKILELKWTQYKRDVDYGWIPRIPSELRKWKMVKTDNSCSFNKMLTQKINI